MEDDNIMSNTYKLSDGTRLSKSIIDARVRKAKAEILDRQMREHGYNFCKSCKQSAGVRLDCAHIISVDACQKLGASEMAYDPANIEVLCRSCHRKRDGLDLALSVTHKSSWTRENNEEHKTRK